MPWVLLFGLGCASLQTCTQDVLGPQEASTASGVARLTPEQVRNTFADSFGANYGYPEEDGRLHSYITGYLAVPLGGNDFSLRVRARDTSTKVQTLLVARAIAWPIAVHLVENETQYPPPPNTIFTKCSFAEDYPGKDPESRARWVAQLEDFYLRHFSRPIAEEEVALIEGTFEAVRTREGNTASAWLVTLFALASSMETWNTWR